MLTYGTIKKQTKEFLHFLWHDAFILFILIFFTRDPCNKKCLVKACCKNQCEQKIYYDNLCGYDNSLWLTRLSILSMAFGISYFTYIFSVTILNFIEFFA